MTENTEILEFNDDHGPIELVQEGMTVVDQQGEKVGKVKFVKMGDAEAITDRGEQSQSDSSMVDQVQSVLGFGIHLPDAIISKLLRVGYIRLSEGLLQRDEFVPANFMRMSI